MHIYTPRPAPIYEALRLTTGQDNIPQRKTAVSDKRKISPSFSQEENP